MTKRFEITDKMAKGFAAEMDAKFEMTSRRIDKNVPVLNFVLNIKCGTSRKISETKTKKNFIYTMLMPFCHNGKKQKGWVFEENGNVTAESVKWLLEAVVKHMVEFENHLEMYKADPTKDWSDWFKDVVKHYGVADLEKRIAEFYEYLTNLGGAEVSDAPMLNNIGGLSMFAVVEQWWSSCSGTEYDCSKVFETFESAKNYVMGELDDFLEWYKNDYLEDLLNDQEELDYFNENLVRINDDKRQLYGVYPYHGDKRWFECKITNVSLIK